ncbi:FMN-dependent NADH-azoreductase [Jannaschia seohaensis]|uniref:FMN dependent NADH:quinone oxidoreductase n=1 Tax=Jannaschia seohaensis TaxID=475081 RepID=A0A2Y9A204_9RHOB|nr:NAD(P)H-dependent oxidoreductase [Jannaschia seohaensis]PWJ22202.1 FMN-dependent NADH-azoreductase [Jannaschia seohaensis]SSA38480.1 FMN-dependent NADH-azoreductase [Jannaschia seohaensis]
MTQILRIDSSARFDGSVSRDLTGRIVDMLDGEVTHLDLARTPLPQITETWMHSNFTPAEERSEAQREALAQSDALVAQLQAADTVVIGLPVYNFSVPAALKAWIDLVARAGVTFRYTENGPEGLLKGKRAIVAMASGGTQEGSPIDFASPYLRHMLGFLGITDVTFITADTLMIDAEAAMGKAEAQLAKLAA